MIRGYVPSDIVPVPMITPGTRAVAGSRKPTKTPGVAVTVVTTEAKRSMERQARNQRARGALNRNAGRKLTELRELDEKLAKAAKAAER